MRKHLQNSTKNISKYGKELAKGQPFNPIEGDNAKHCPPQR